MTRDEEPSRSIQETGHVNASATSENGSSGSLTDLIDVLQREAFNRRFDARSKPRSSVEDYDR